MCLVDQGGLLVLIKLPLSWGEFGHPTCWDTSTFKTLVSLFRNNEGRPTDFKVFLHAVYSEVIL